MPNKATSSQSPEPLLPGNPQNLGLTSQGKVKIKSLANDAAVLRQLVGELNNPVLAGAVLPKTESEDSSRILNSPLANGENDLPATPAPSAGPLPPAPASIVEMISSPVPENPASPVLIASTPPSKLFITGRQSAIERLLAGVRLGDSARLVSLNRTAAEVFGAVCMLKGEAPPALVATFRAWGDGDVQRFPYTVERLLFLGLIRQKYPEFGTPGFWAKLPLDAVSFSGSQKQAIVVGVNSAAEFKALEAAGFTHFHAWTNSVPGIGEPSSGLLTALDNDVARKISAQKTGPPRLRVVWMDDPARCPTLDRLMLPEQFRKSVLSQPETVVESALVI